MVIEMNEVEEETKEPERGENANRLTPPPMMAREDLKEDSPLKEITDPLKENEWVCEDCTFINTLPHYHCASK